MRDRRGARTISGLGVLVALLGLGALASAAHDQEIASRPGVESRPSRVQPPVVPTVADGADEREPLAALRAGRPMDVNRASVRDLELLPRIGPSLADRIVTHRTRHGPFTDVRGLEAVRGIGPATVEQLRPLVCAGRSCDEADAEP